LTNIHRHSGSSRAEVALKLSPDKVTLEVRDFGHGIPPERLKNFQGVGTNFGVGLAGMRERLRELGGQLEIRSERGTIVSVTMPLRESAKAVDASAAD
jgi:signal transduction histidine kinase